MLTVTLDVGLFAYNFIYFEMMLTVKQVLVFTVLTDVTVKKNKETLKAVSVKGSRNLHNIWFMLKILSVDVNMMMAPES